MDQASSDPLNPSVPNVPTPPSPVVPGAAEEAGAGATDAALAQAEPQAAASVPAGEPSLDATTEAADAAPPQAAQAPEMDGMAATQKTSVVDGLNQQKQQIFDAMAAEKARVLADTKGIGSGGVPLQGLPGLDYLVATEIVRTLQQIVNKAVDERLEQLLGQVGGISPGADADAGEPQTRGR